MIDRIIMNQQEAEEACDSHPPMVANTFSAARFTGIRCGAVRFGLDTVEIYLLASFEFDGKGSSDVMGA
jgi:hypothetical protein